MFPFRAGDRCVDRRFRSTGIAIWLYLRGEEGLSDGDGWKRGGGGLAPWFSERRAEVPKSLLWWSKARVKLEEARFDYYAELRPRRARSMPETGVPREEPRKGGENNPPCVGISFQDARCDAMAWLAARPAAPWQRMRRNTSEGSHAAGNALAPLSFSRGWSRVQPRRMCRVLRAWPSRLLIGRVPGGCGCRGGRNRSLKC